MGLGKSVEALAAMCHLAVEGQRHFLVVCPASVLVNWTHEITRHSELRSTGCTALTASGTSGPGSV